MALGIAVTKQTASDPLFSFRSTTTNLKMGAIRAETTRNTGQSSQTAFDAFAGGKSKSTLNIAPRGSEIFQEAKGSFSGIRDRDLEVN